MFFGNSCIIIHTFTSMRLSSFRVLSAGILEAMKRHCKCQVGYSRFIQLLPCPSEKEEANICMEITCKISTYLFQHSIKLDKTL